MRSRCRCSMSPAIHIKSRSWLRSSSTHEPSDPPLRVIFSFYRMRRATRRHRHSLSETHTQLYIYGTTQPRSGDRLGRTRGAPLQSVATVVVTLRRTIHLGQRRQDGDRAHPPHRVGQTAVFRRFFEPRVAHRGSDERDAGPLSRRRDVGHRRPSGAVRPSRKKRGAERANGTDRQRSRYPNTPNGTLALAPLTASMRSPTEVRAPDARRFGPTRSGAQRHRPAGLLALLCACMSRCEQRTHTPDEPR